MRRKMIALLGILCLMAFVVPQTLAMEVEDGIPSLGVLWTWFDSLLTSIIDLFGGNDPVAVPTPSNEPDEVGGFVEPLG